MKIETMDHTPPEIEKKTREGWAEYERPHSVNFNCRHFSMILTDDEGNAVGLLKGRATLAEIRVSELFIDSNHRRKGLGRKLLHELEEQFEGKGFWNINLCTSEYQAPGFYKKCGFELEFVRKNFRHPKLTKYFFVKYFKNEIQNQGILSGPFSSPSPSSSS